MTWLTALRLGRVSNLPTVWTNALAGVVLSGGALGLGGWGLLLIGLSLLYVAGMYLNDAFDAGIDAVERPSRPIPSGEASRIAVFANGFGLLAVGAAVHCAVRWRRAASGRGPGRRDRRL
jgi:4-hydroxybenzoate polyprenyltransferase